MEKNAIDYCKDVDRANEALFLQERIKKSQGNFYEFEKNSAPLFSREVSFLVRASQGHDHDFNDLLIERLEIRPSLDNNNSKLFCFSLILVLVAKNGETFWFRIARTSNYVSFYLVQCKDNDFCVIETGDGVCARFILGSDFMETLQFCYESIDSFNENLEIKLAEHILYLCQIPLPRVKKPSLFPDDYLLTGMSIEIFNGGGPIGKAIISIIEKPLIDSYPGTKILRTMEVSKYFPKNQSFVFIPGAPNLKEGWYPTTSKYDYNPEGPVYEIKPA